MAANRSSREEHEKHILEIILDHSEEAIALIDQDGVVRHVGAGMERLFGYHRKQMNAVANCIKLMHPTAEERKVAMRDWEQLIRAQKAGSHDFWVRRKDGARRWIRFRVSFAADLLILNCRDVTEEKDIHERLRYARFTVDQAAVAIFWIRSDATITYANEAASTLMEKPAAEIVGTKIYDIDPYLSQDSWADNWSQLRVGRHGMVETEYVLDSGRHVPVLIYGRMISSEHDDYVCAYVQDQTVRQRTESALRESEEKFRNLADESPNMIFINRGGRVVYTNRKCEEVMGYTREEFCSESFDFMSVIASESLNIIRQNFLMHQEAKEVQPCEYGLVTKTGRRVDAYITTKLITFEGERAILGIVTDVTELKQAQREVARTAEELRLQRDALEKKNIALKEILEQLEAEKKEMRHELAANMERLLLPLVRKLKRQSGTGDENTLGQLEQRIGDLISGQNGGVNMALTSLTPSEIQICDLIRTGLSSKEIAEFLGIAVRTVETHRNNIRRKLGVANRRVNLISYLRGLEASEKRRGFDT